jgi:hypothetical protein
MTGPFFTVLVTTYNREDVVERCETMLAHHGAELAVHAPTLWRGLHEGAAAQAFLAGRRSARARRWLATANRAAAA